MENLDNLILDAPAPAQRRLEYAGFWIRLVALVVDTIVLYVLNQLIDYAFFSSYVSEVVGESGLASLFTIYNLIGILVAAAYDGLLESSSTQGTLGKMAVGIKVGDEKGNRISFMNAIGRHFSKYLSAIVLFIGFIMVAFDIKNQGLHDKIASTVVYYG